MLGVIAGSPAARAGLRAAEQTANGRVRLGDVIEAIDGRPIENFGDARQRARRARVRRSRHADRAARRRARRGAGHARGGRRDARAMTGARTVKLLLLVGVAILAACSSGRRIDGSSAATFERSVAMLQNDLPPRSREEFDIALAITWMRAAALDGGDVDGDGDTDYFDARAMADNAGDLLAAIQRGDLVSAASKTAKAKPSPRPISSSSTGLGYARVVVAAPPVTLDAEPVQRLQAGKSQTAVRWGRRRQGYRPPLGNTQPYQKVRLIPVRGASRT